MILGMLPMKSDKEKTLWAISLYALYSTINQVRHAQRPTGIASTLWQNAINAVDGHKASTITLQFRFVDRRLDTSSQTPDSSTLRRPS